ncbi:uncharacterized protein LOC143288807 [Babylonia areolata]|uniref:uncharacterized protein LOC143288807 n=1 Tax=Babylonia areolata TaxID=304850 RepID=UPI003FD6B412
MLNLISLVIIISLAGSLTLTNAFRMKRCWPSNETEARCFGSIPPSKVPWPTEGRDSYVSGNVEVMDLDDFSVTSVEKDPRDVCRFKDELYRALKCMMEDVAAKCPNLPDEILSKPDRMLQAFNGFCDQIDQIDPACLLTHWETTMQCHEEMLGHGKWGKGGNTTSRSRPRPPSSSSYPPTSEPEAEGANSTSPPEPEWKPPQGRMDRKAWNNLICLMTYQMTKCVKQNVQTCDVKTADVMVQFMKDMSSPRCAAKMQAWEAQEVGGGGASNASVTWATVLSAFCLVLVRVW